MNYPEELRERYNEVMLDERDIIEKFLKDQYDLRYGRQCDTWHFEPAVKMMNIYGNEIVVTDIRLDKDRFVVFDGMFGNLKDKYECFDFAYGELSKVIEALPNADEIIRKNVIEDLNMQQMNLRLDLLLKESPFTYEFNGEVITYDGIDRNKKFLFDVIGKKYGVDCLVKFRDHIHIEHLHRTDEYKEVMERLSLLENMCLEFASPNVVMFDIKNTDMKVDILSVQRDDTKLSMRVMCVDDEEVLTLEEKDIFKEYLYDLAKWMKAWVSTRCDIIDPYNGHNTELVRKINDAWNKKNYHERFGAILLALLTRDKEEFENRFDCDVELTEEFAYTNANQIMEGVCDDEDLETILSFIRYIEYEKVL